MDSSFAVGLALSIHYWDMIKTKVIIIILHPLLDICTDLMSKYI